MPPNNTQELLTFNKTLPILCYTFRALIAQWVWCNAIAHQLFF